MFHFTFQKLHPLSSNTDIIATFNHKPLISLGQSSVENCKSHK